MDMTGRIWQLWYVLIMVALQAGCVPSSRSPGTPMNISILIIPIGNPKLEDLEYLKKELGDKFGDCTVGNKIEMPPEAYNPSREQYMSDILLQCLSKIRPGIAAEARILGVAEEDLYSPGLNFVFGQAQFGGRCAVISLKRLDPAFYGMTPDEKIYRLRMVKEAVHELGHVLGIEHCPDRRCVMHFSNSLRDTDVKGDWFCGQCLAKFGKR
mgnify:CR=1 FL=1